MEHALTEDMASAWKGTSHGCSIANTSGMFASTLASLDVVNLDDSVANLV